MSTIAQSEHRLISSDRVIGTDVYGLGDDTIGQIDHLLIEKVSGRIAYAWRAASPAIVPRRFCV